MNFPKLVCLLNNRVNITICKFKRNHLGNHKVQHAMKAGSKQSNSMINIVQTASLKDLE